MVWSVSFVLWWWWWWYPDVPAMFARLSASGRRTGTFTARTTFTKKWHTFRPSASPDSVCFLRWRGRSLRRGSTSCDHGTRTVQVPHARQPTGATTRRAARGWQGVGQCPGQTVHVVPHPHGPRSKARAIHDAEHDASARLPVVPQHACKHATRTHTRTHLFHVVEADVLEVVQLALLQHVLQRHPVLPRPPVRLLLCLQRKVLQRLHRLGLGDAHLPLLLLRRCRRSRSRLRLRLGLGVRQQRQPLVVQRDLVVDERDGVTEVLRASGAELRGQTGGEGSVTITIT